MNARKLSALCVSLLFASTLVDAQAPLLVTPAAASPSGVLTVPAPPQVPTQAYVVMDYSTGRVLAEQNARTPLEPASITKLMTGYLVFSAIRDKRLRLDEEVVISEHAWRSEGSRTFVKVGSRVPADVLIKGMIVQSGNDATIALAERVAGTEPAFVELMNQQAARLGMKDTHFENSWGGPAPTHRSSAYDLAILGQALIRDFPEDYQLYSLREFVWNNIRQQNRNGLLGRDPTVDGIKTGHTDSARYCLVSSALRNGMRLITVVLGSDTVKDREDASAALLNYGYTYYETLKLQSGKQMVLKPRVYKASEEFVPVGVARDIHVTVVRGQAGAIEKNVELRGKLLAPLPAGTTVGQLTIKSGGLIVAQAPLVTLAVVPEGGLLDTWVDTVKLWLQ
jgi:D-alanyl-D-alanine carboxypeptidase (penicillin-binding protein 5/6)